MNPCCRPSETLARQGPTAIPGAVAKSTLCRARLRPSRTEALDRRDPPGWAPVHELSGLGGRAKDRIVPQHREGSGQDRLSELLRPPDGKVADVVEVGRLVRDRGLEIDEPDVGVGRVEVADYGVVRCERRGHGLRTSPNL